MSPNPAICGHPEKKDSMPVLFTLHVAGNALGRGACGCGVPGEYCLLWMRIPGGEGEVDAVDVHAFKVSAVDAGPALPCAVDRGVPHRLSRARACDDNPCAGDVGTGSADDGIHERPAVASNTGRTASHGVARIEAFATGVGSWLTGLDRHVAGRGAR